MAAEQPSRRKMRTYTVVALLGIFVGAALLALAGRLLPGSLSRLVPRAPAGRRYNWRKLARRQ